MDQEAEMVKAIAKEEYNQALNDCIGLLRKWFYGTNKDARACEVDVRKLMKK